MSKKRIVIIGASSAIAAQCARRWADESADFILVGRELSRVQQVADDLRVRSPQSVVEEIQIDFNDTTDIKSLVDHAAQAAIDIVLIAHGNLPQQPECERDIDIACEALLVNGLSPVLFAEAFAAQLIKQGHGSLAVIGSVAGDRGRKSNYVYGSAKGMVERYLQGLQHRVAGSAVKVVLIKPGPTATPMTAHLPQPGLASAESVARAIVHGIDSGKPVVYAPAKWWLIMMVIRHLPRFIFNKLDI